MTCCPMLHRRLRRWLSTEPDEYKHDAVNVFSRGAGVALLDRPNYHGALIPGPRSDPTCMHTPPRAQQMHKSESCTGLSDLFALPPSSGAAPHNARSETSQTISAKLERMSLAITPSDHAGSPLTSGALHNHEPLQALRVATLAMQVAQNVTTNAAFEWSSTDCNAESEDNTVYVLTHMRDIPEDL